MSSPLYFKFVEAFENKNWLLDLSHSFPSSMGIIIFFAFDQLMLMVLVDFKILNQP